MRDKIRRKPVFSRKTVISIHDMPCRYPGCDGKVNYRILYHLDGFSYYLMVCKDHRDWAEGLAEGFEDVISKHRL